MDNYCAFEKLFENEDNTQIKNRDSALKKEFPDNYISFYDSTLEGTSKNKYPTLFYYNFNHFSYYAKDMIFQTIFKKIQMNE